MTCHYIRSVPACASPQPSPTALSLIAFAYGIAVAVAAANRAYGAGLACWLVNRLLADSTAA